MALKPTIYKFDIDLSDIDEGRYENLNLTVAQHPSETLERMMVRLLAYCLNLSEGLEFTTGLSNTEEPDLLQRSLDGITLKWIEVGEPSAERIRKASTIAKQVKVYCFNTKANAWWSQAKTEIENCGANVYQFQWEQISELAGLIKRTVALSVTITGMTAFIAGESGSVEVTWAELTNA
ncbi:MAG: hypothetical protein ACI883_001361 [Candidatus Azotimanducaceae bacterium]|jgi:uncharacterized protein YaeQ|tara:strand:+ start:770 stop:1306 length:537 start_codon:yes stop_codon:yes gene_type:complete